MKIKDDKVLHLNEDPLRPLKSQLNSKLRVHNNPVLHITPIPCNDAKQVLPGICINFQSPRIRKAKLPLDVFLCYALLRQ